MPHARQDFTMLTLSRLRTRGWTPTLIRIFLGEPDLTKPNPHYRNGAPMKLYSLARIEAAETRPEWRSAELQACRRSARARLRAEWQAQDLVLRAQDTPIALQAIPASALLYDAIKHYNFWQREALRAYGFETYRQASHNSPACFLRRIQVDYARYELTQYDRGLEALIKRVGVRRAETTLRRRIYAKIAAVYIWLENECARQLMQQRQREQDAAQGSTAQESVRART